ncbi:MAG: CoA-binding protein [Gemmatimonadetes bacterium]|nr:CoA-binding protein [Gemmatimonadota bacterium]
MRSTGRAITHDDEIVEVLGRVQRIAILGIKPGSRAHKPAHFVPRYLQDVGYDIIPVPVYYPDVTEILGRTVYRTVSAIPGVIDLVVVFRKSGDIPPHLDDLIAKRPGTVWFQLGIRNDPAAQRLIGAGIDVVQDRCAMIEHEKLR